MNERIRKLAKQAGFGLHRDGEIYTSRLEHLPITEDIEKFAELVVEECRYVMDCNKGSDQHTEWNRALSETSDKIQKHFGVEE